MARRLPTNRPILLTSLGPPRPPRMTPPGKQGRRHRLPCQLLRMHRRRNSLRPISQFILSIFRPTLLVWIHGLRSLPERSLVRAFGLTMVTNRATAISKRSFRLVRGLWGHFGNGFLSPQNGSLTSPGVTRSAGGDNEVLTGVRIRGHQGAIQLPH